MTLKQHIPNAMTCCNLLCGCLAIVKVFEGHFIWASYLVGLAVLFDFFDGFVARLLNARSPIGKDLDSLADMVTFGVVPGMMVYKYLYVLEGSSQQYQQLREHYHWVNGLAFLIPLFSALRLAKFNNDARQSDSFIGLPTPANALFWCSIPFFNNSPILTPYLLLGTVVLCSGLLIAEIPLFALKFKHFKWQGNEVRYVFLGLSLALLAIFHFTGIPAIIILYVLLSLRQKK